jgi:hypothetical protein
LSTRIHHPALLAATIGASVILAACGKHDPAPPIAAPAAVAGAKKPAVTATASAATASTIAATPSSPVAAVPLAGTGMVNTVAGTPLAPAASTAFAIAGVTLGDAVNPAHEITRQASSFAADDKILYASVATTGNSTGVTLNAKWRYLEGQGQMFSSTSQSIATDGPAVTTFKVQNPDLWPEGRYKVEISLDGKPVASENFQIGKG